MAVSEIGAAEVIKWLRQHAQTMMDAANDLEQALISGPPTRWSAKTGDSPAVQAIERMKTELRSSARRAPELANLTGISERMVNDIIKDHPDIFHRGARGWLILKDQEA